MRFLMVPFLFAASCFPVVAESFTSLQISTSALATNYTSSVYEWQTGAAKAVPHEVRTISVGINVTGFNGEEFGIIGTSNIFFGALKAQDNNKPINLGDFSFVLSQSVLLGLGYRFPLSDSQLILGAGPHFSTLMLSARWKPYDGTPAPESINTGMNAGLGVVGLFKSRLLSNLYWASTLSLGYDFVPLLNFDGHTGVSAWDASVSTGLGITF